MPRAIKEALVGLAVLLVCLSLAVVADGCTSKAAAAPQPCTDPQVADLSNWNSGFDFSKADVAGLYVLEGDGGWTDPVFKSYTDQAQANGKPWGGYYFGEPTTDQNTINGQAFSFVWNGGASGTLPPVLDLEVSDGLNPSDVASYAVSWINAVETYSHRVVTLYTGSGYPWAYDQRLTAYPLWVAAYPLGYTPTNSACGLSLPGTAAWSTFSGWQFTSSATVGNIHPVDLSVFSADWWEIYTGAAVTSGGLVWGPGSVGPTVTQIQQIVGAPQTGTYDATTEAQVAAFQAKLGVQPADGAWGPKTQTAYENLLRYLAATLTPRPTPPLHKGQTGDNVKRLQHALNVVGAKDRGRKIRENGRYDASLSRAVHEWKTFCRLPGKFLTGNVWKQAAQNCLTFYLGVQGK